MHAWRRRCSDCSGTRSRRTTSNIGCSVVRACCAAAARHWTFFFFFFSSAGLGFNFPFPFLFPLFFRASPEQSRYKTLKANYDELEKGFTAKSEENMRLATELETATYSNGPARVCGGATLRPASSLRPLTVLFSLLLPCVLSNGTAMLGRQLNETRRAAVGASRSTGAPPPQQQAEATQTQPQPLATMTKPAPQASHVPLQSASVQTTGAAATTATAATTAAAASAEESEELESLRVQLRELRMQKAQLMQVVSLLARRQGWLGVPRLPVIFIFLLFLSLHQNGALRQELDSRSTADGTRDSSAPHSEVRRGRVMCTSQSTQPSGLTCRSCFSRRRPTAKAAAALATKARASPRSGLSWRSSGGVWRR